MTKPTNQLLLFVATDLFWNLLWTQTVLYGKASLGNFRKMVLILLALVRAIIVSS